MTATIFKRSTLVVSIGLFFITLAVRAVFIWRTGFDGLYGQDAFAYFDYATAFRAALTQGQVPPPFFWPIGYPALIALFSLILPQIPAAQAISLVATGLVVVLTFLMTRELLIDHPHELVASSVAALIVAFAGQMLISSLSSMSDAASLAWATLSAFAILRFHRGQARRWLVVAGFSLGWAVMTRWVYALLIPVWVAALVAEAWDADTCTCGKCRCRREDTRIKNNNPRSSAFIHVLIALGFFVAALSPQIALIARDANQADFPFLGDAQTYSWNLANAGQSSITNADGQFHYAQPVALYYALPLIHPDYLPVWFTPLVVLGVWALRRQRSVMLLLLGWIGVNWVFLAGVAWENWRFPLAFFPPLAILAGVGLQALLVNFEGRRLTIATGTSVVGPAVGVGLVLLLAWGGRDAGDFIARQMQDRAVMDWASAQLPRDATVLCFGMTATLAHLTSFQVVEIADETPASVEKIARTSPDVFLLVDVNNIESQWRGLAPQLNLDALRETFALRSLGTRVEYVLYAVGSAR